MKDVERLYDPPSILVRFRTNTCGEQWSSNWDSKFREEKSCYSVASVQNQK